MLASGEFGFRQPTDSQKQGKSGPDRPALPDLPSPAVAELREGGSAILADARGWQRDRWAGIAALSLGVRHLTDEVGRILRTKFDTYGKKKTEEEVSNHNGIEYDRKIKSNS